MTNATLHKWKTFIFLVGEAPEDGVMDRSGWTEIRDTSKPFAENRAYMKEVNGHVLLVKRGLVSGHWWPLIDNRPIGGARVALVDAMLLCERHAEGHKKGRDMDQETVEGRPATFR